MVNTENANTNSLAEFKETISTLIEEIEDYIDALHLYTDDEVIQSLKSLNENDFSESVPFDQ